MNAQRMVSRLLEDDIPGGSQIGDAHATHAVDQRELRMGIEVEMEHTTDPRVAEEIALDHLAEDPRYYSKGRRKGMFPELANGGGAGPSQNGP